MSKKPKYCFEGSVLDQLQGFEVYLYQKGNRASTLRQKSNYVGLFLEWLHSQQRHALCTTYNDLLSLIDHCTQLGHSKAHINRTLCSIGTYFEYLATFHPQLINPAANIRIRGMHHPALGGLVEFTQLEELYQCYPCQSPRTYRNKVILGLLIYQALTTEELAQLQIEHLRLRQGLIQVPGNRRRNSRTLTLCPSQVLDLHEYVHHIRPAIVSAIASPKPSRKPSVIDSAKLEQQLFVSICGSHNIKSSLLHLFRDVRAINPTITNAQLIRQSTLSHWLRTTNLRQVQYMAGHKHVGSTERYQLNNLDKLQDKLEKLHPLNDT